MLLLVAIVLLNVGLLAWVIASAIAHSAVPVILLVALRALGVGAELGVTEFFRVFFITHLLGTFAPTPGGVGAIEAALLVHYAEDDPRVNAMREDFEAALKQHGVDYEMHTYPGTRHGFHNYSTPRYSPEAAKLAWDRTVAFFHDHLD